MIRSRMVYLIMWKAIRFFSIQQDYFSLCNLLAVILLQKFLVILLLQQIVCIILCMIRLKQLHSNNFPILTGLF